LSKNPLNPSFHYAIIPSFPPGHKPYGLERPIGAKPLSSIFIDTHNLNLLGLFDKTFQLSASGGMSEFS
jgi:hypothetical protein